MTTTFKLLKGGVPAVLLALALVGQPSAAGGDAAVGYKVVINAANPVTTLSHAQLSRIFLKKMSHWDSGAAIVPVDQSDGSEVRRVFSEEVVGKSVGAVKSFWQQQIFSGRDVPPTQRKSDEAVLAFVKDDPNAIGYVSGAAVVSGVKVVQVSE